MLRPSQIAYMLFESFILSILSQEAGWRGYAIDKLLVRFGFIGSSIILGFACGIWYLGSYLHLIKYHIIWHNTHYLMLFYLYQTLYF